MENNDFRTLAAFLAVAEERSFTRAAKRYGVPPSAMSHAKGISVCACSHARREASRPRKPASNDSRICARRSLMSKKLWTSSRDYATNLRVACGC